MRKIVAKAKPTRVEVQFPPLATAMVRRAAEIQGGSVKDFVIAAAWETAAKTVKDAHIIELSLEDQRAFADAMLSPPKLGPAWKRARESHKRLIKDSV